MNPKNKKRLDTVGSSLLGVGGALSVIYLIGKSIDEDRVAELEEFSQETRHLNLAIQNLEGHAAFSVVEDCRAKAVACTNRYPMPCHGHAFEGEYVDGNLGYRQIDNGKPDLSCQIDLREKLVGCLEGQMECVTEALAQPISLTK